MKINFKIFFPVFLALLIVNSGCNKFLDEELLGERSDQQFFQTAEDAQLSLTGIYNVLSYANSDNRLWVFGDVASDDAVKGGNPGDQADIGLIDEFSITSVNGNLDFVWSIYYEGVSRANWLLDNIGDINMDQTEKDIIIGEAKFLRAYCYYWLASIFGNIPIHLSVPTPEEMQTPAIPFETVFTDVIIPDLKDATTLLTETAQPGRATKYAAYGLMAKSYLMLKNWTEAENAAKAVIQSGKYQLELLYNSNFQKTTKDNSEILFSVQHLAGQDPWLGNRLNQWFAPQATNGYGFNAPTQDFVDEFEVTPEGYVDPRLDYTVGREGHIWTDTMTFDPTWSPTGFLNRKYIQPLAEASVESKADGELNYQFMRYSDILLMMAEALNEQGKSSEAIPYVNLVRARARDSFKYDPLLPGYSDIPAGMLPDIQDNGQDGVRNSIRHERRVELGFEFHRYIDIIRYGQVYANATFSNYPNFNYENNKFMPIPQIELDTNFELKNSK